MTVTMVGIFLLGAIIGFLIGLICGVIIMTKIEEDTHKTIEEEIKYFHGLAEKAKKVEK